MSVEPSGWERRICFNVSIEGYWGINAAAVWY